MAKARTTTWDSTILLLTALLLTSSCTGDTLWHRYAHIDVNGWHSNDTIAFELPSTLTEGNYSMDIELRVTPAFPYQRLYMMRQILFTNPADTCRDTISIQTSATGQQLTGEGMTVHSFTQQAPDFNLAEGQQACVQFFHIMSRGTLPHIMDMGIKVKASK